ncbi:MAG TPA: hypothetical protein P5038_21690 [Candidatus Paceibacterota bacterium]|nr:hypothetical protein [Kiritimatiellia bacterium]HRT59249.1 hypothetical protein [Candidatus Paceibacterota bacterium]
MSTFYDLAPWVAILAGVIAWGWGILIIARCLSFTERPEDEFHG